jgi:hypothetical protein
MDDEIIEPRSDPRITVEIAPGTEPTQAASRAIPRPGCPHRVKWRDFNPVAKYFMLENLALTIGAVPVAVLCFALGVNGMREALQLGSSEKAVLPFLAILVSVPLALGGIASLWSNQRFHRPNAVVYVLHTVAFVVLVAGLIALSRDREWILLAAVPGLAVMNDLRDSRARLRDRSTCRTDPTLPPEFLEAAFKWSDDGPAEDSRPPTRTGTGEWVCPHHIVWKQLRPWAFAEFVVHRAIRFAYFGGTAMLLLAVWHGSDELPTGPLDDRAAMLALVLVPLVFNLIAFNEWNSGPNMHRQQVVVYVWCIVAFGSTAALAGWTATVLDRSYLWSIVPLAACSIYLTLWRAVLYSDPLSCENEPDLHPRVRARLRG